MAGIDYYNCDCCGQGKILYDADIEWPDKTDNPRFGAIAMICNNCSGSLEIVFRHKNTGEIKTNYWVNLWGDPQVIPQHKPKKEGE